MLSQITLVPASPNHFLLGSKALLSGPVEGLLRSTLTGGSSTFLKAPHDVRAPDTLPRVTTAAQQSPAGSSPRDCPRLLLEFPRTRLSRRPPLNPVFGGSTSRPKPTFTTYKLSRRFHSLCALPSIPLSFSLATILPPEPKDCNFLKVREESRWTVSYPWSVSFIVKTTTVSDRFRTLNFRS